MKTHLFILLIQVLFLSTAAGQNKEFKEAKKENSISAYNQFLADFPETKFTEEAKKRKNSLCMVEWKRVASYGRNRLEYFEKFIAECSGSDAEAKAREKLEYYEWDNTYTGSDQIERIEKFLEKYPTSERKEKAETRLGEMKIARLKRNWEKARQADRISAMDSFLTAYPNSEYEDSAKFLIDEMKTLALPRAAKAGDIGRVKELLAANSNDMKSRALMESVWGFLHTSQKYRWDNGSLILYPGRSGRESEETYMNIIKILLDSGADPKRYTYADFGSVEVRAKENEPEQQRFASELREKGYAETSYSFGPSELSGTYLDYGKGGLSIQEVAEIHKSEELLKLLR